MFGALALLFVGLVGRSMYLQWIDNEFLQTQGSARHSRDLEVPAHRGRIVDRFGEPLALSTPVKSLWAFPDKFEATPEQLAQLARILDTTPQRMQAQPRRARATSRSSRGRSRRRPPSARWRCASRACTTRTSIAATIPGGEVTAHVIGFTGDRDAGQEGMELAQQTWLAGVPGSRRVIINRRSEAVEDVAAIRAPQAGRDLALAIDSRLQYLAFRELKAAVEQNKAKAGGLVILDVATGEILALANWPTYNPNRRDKVARERMRNRALTDVFEPGSTLKPFTIAAALDAGKIRPDTVIQTGGGTLHDRPQHDPRRACGRRAHRRAGDPEVVERRRREDRARSAAPTRCGTCSPTWASARRRRPGFPGEVAGPLAPGEDVEAHRAGDDGVWPRHLGQPRAARARLHDLRHRRRSEARHAAARPTATSRDGRC